jgi:hypothetical protein
MKRIAQILVGFLIVAASAIMARPAYGATVYSNFTAFSGVLNAGYYSNDFESFTHGNQSTHLIMLSGGTPTISMNMTDTSGFYVVANATLPSGQAMSTNNLNDTITIDFTSDNVIAVGADFFLTQEDEALVAGAMNVTLNDGTVVNVTSPASGPVEFFGFSTNITDPITSLTITTNSSQYNTLDNLYVGTVAVPEPAEAAVLGGLAAAVLAVRARRKSRMTA